MFLERVERVAAEARRSEAYSRATTFALGRGARSGFFENTRPRLERVGMTIREKSRFIERFGQAAYLKLPLHRRP